MISKYIKAPKLPALATEYKVSSARQEMAAGTTKSPYESYWRWSFAIRKEHTVNRRLKEAQFPDIKTLEQLDWGPLHGTSRQKIMELVTYEFLTKAQVQRTEYAHGEQTITPWNGDLQKLNLRRLRHSLVVLSISSQEYGHVHRP